MVSWRIGLVRKCLAFPASAPHQIREHKKGMSRVFAVFLLFVSW